jgi:hypothetical protein
LILSGWRTSRSGSRDDYLSLVGLAPFSYLAFEEIVDLVGGVLLDGLHDWGELDIVLLGELSLVPVDDLAEETGFLPEEAAELF